MADKVRIAKFVEGETSFLGKGISTIKVEKDGEAVYYEIPIKSIGIFELQEELSREAPKPPVILKTIDKDTELGKRLGLKDDAVMKTYDFTDDKYQKEFDKYKDDFLWRIIIRAIDAEFYDKEGNKIEDFEKKKKALIGAGITGHHVTQIFRDVNRLTSDREEMADFLFERAWGLPNRF